MNLEELNIIIFVTGAILGCIATLAVKSASSKSSNKQSASSSSAATIHSLQQELDKKQVIIDDFFTDSSKHLHATEKHLEALRKALAAGAGQVSSVTISDSRTTTPATSDELDPISDTAPPRDYALKDDSDEGMLSEKFGLDNRQAKELEPNRSL